MATGRTVDVGSVRLNVVERGQGPAVIVLHGGPGLDHESLGHYLDPLADQFRLIFVDQRGHGRSSSGDPETWTLAQLAEDVDALARTLDLGSYAVLGHSFGAFVALQHAIDTPNSEVTTVLCGAVPDVKYFAAIDEALESFQPADLREEIGAAMEQQATADSADELRQAFQTQLPFMFADSTDARIGEYEETLARTIFSPAVSRHFVTNDYGGIDVEDHLDRVRKAMLVLAGRHDRICSVPAAESIADKVNFAELTVFEHSGHFPFVEEQDRFLAVVRNFLNKELSS